MCGGGGGGGGTDGGGGGEGVIFICMRYAEIRATAALSVNQ